MSDESKQLIEGKRDSALIAHRIYKTKHSYTPAAFVFKGDTMKGKLRLKGDIVDHLRSDRWSFRIKLKKKGRLNGMKTFSIQHPKTRGYLNEWLIFKVFEEMDLITLRYQFAHVFINGEDKGTYAVEESFAKQLLTNNKRPVGPILKLDESLGWEYYDDDGKFKDHEMHLSSPIQNYIDPEIKKGNDSLLQQESFAIQQLEKFRRGELSPDKIFDLEKMGKFMAVCDLFSADHGLRWNNRRYYFNPATSLLEPIPYDLDCDHFRETLIIQEFYKPSPSLLSEHKRLYFDNPLFYKHYVETLIKLSEKSFLKSLLNNHKEDLAIHSLAIEKKNPEYRFDPSNLYRKQKFIHQTIFPKGGVEAYALMINDRDLSFECTNIIPFPIHITGISYNDGAYKEEISRRLDRRLYNTALPYTNINLKLNHQIKVGETINVFYQIEGIDSTYHTEMNWTNHHQKLQFNNKKNGKKK